MHDLLRISDLDADELLGLLDLAIAFKDDPREFAGTGRGRVVGILFEKPSLRTRFSLESALVRIGASPIGAYDREVGLGTREPITDAAAVMAGYVDAIVMRTFEHERVQALAEASDVPVINALTLTHHPLQALADLQTLIEAVSPGDARGIKGTRIAWVGDGNNVCHSLLEACALAGASFAIACPEGHEPSARVLEWARAQGCDVTVGTDPVEAVTGAAAVSTDVWTSMGQEDETAAREKLFAPYQVTSSLMTHAAKDAIFLHCLPAHRGEEVAADVIDGSASRVFDQAHNRMHTAAAVFVRLFGEA